MNFGVGGMRWETNGGVGECEWVRSPGIHSQDASHLLEIFAPFPSVVSDSLRRLPCTWIEEMKLIYLDGMRD